MGGFELTVPETYPAIAFPNYTEPGASTVLKVAVFMLATSLLAGKKKRDAPIARDSESQLLFKVLSDLDQDDCIANAICYAAAKPSASRSEGELKLLSVIGNEPETPVAWLDMGLIEAKYRYAGFVGFKSINENETDCQEIFRRCPTSPEQIVQILTNSDLMKPCDGSLPILSQPLVTSSDQDLQLPKLSENEVESIERLGREAKLSSSTYSILKPSVTLIVKEKSSI